jgi:hypothetical protein
MGELYFTLPDGTTMPFAQAAAIERLSKLHGPDTHWHRNDCGCCVTLHPDGDHQRGYVINSDGDFDYHDLRS